MITENSIRIAQDGTAWKTPLMLGYIKKTVLDAATHGENAYKLTFVKKDGSEYPFFFDNGTGVSATNLILDKDLLKNLLISNWSTGKAEVFEQARGTPTVW